MVLMFLYIVLTMVLTMFNFLVFGSYGNSFLSLIIESHGGLGAHYSVNKGRDKLATKCGNCGLVNFLLL